MHDNATIAPPHDLASEVIQKPPDSE